MIEDTIVELMANKKIKWKIILNPIGQIRINFSFGKVKITWYGSHRERKVKTNNANNLAVFFGGKNECKNLIFYVLVFLHLELSFVGFCNFPLDHFWDYTIPMQSNNMCRAKWKLEEQIEGKALQNYICGKWGILFNKMSNQHF